MSSGNEFGPGVGTGTEDAQHDESNGIVPGPTHDAASDERG